MIFFVCTNVNYESKEHLLNLKAGMRLFTRFGTICTILKTWKNTHGGVLKVTILHGCFSRFLYCTNGNKSRKASHIIKRRVSAADFDQFLYQVTSGRNFSLTLLKVACPSFVKSNILFQGNWKSANVTLIYFGVIGSLFKPLAPGVHQKVIHT